MKKTLIILMVVSSFPVYAQLDSLLVGCYSLDGHVGDSSGNANHGILVGATTTKGRMTFPNTAYYFDGIDDHILIPNFQNMITGDELSISLFGKSDGGGKCLFMLSPDSSDRCVGCAMYQNTSYFWDYGDFFNGGRMSHTLTGDTNWHHYVFVISSTNSYKAIYMDGIVLKSGNSTLPLLNKNRDLMIGAGTDHSNGNIRWKGSIDDIHIYNRALAAWEVSNLYGSDHICYETETGINSHGINKSVEIHPNPVNSELYISNLFVNQSALKLYNMQGVEFLSEKISGSEAIVNVSHLPEGIYYLRLNLDGKTQTQKVMIQH